MKIVMAIAGALCLLAGSAQADVLYTYTGNPFTTVSGAYTRSDYLTISFTLQSALAANLSLNSTSLGVVPTSWLLADANSVLSISSSMAGNRSFSFRFATDAQGAITGWQIEASTPGTGSGPLPIHYDPQCLLNDTCPTQTGSTSYTPPTTLASEYIPGTEQTVTSGPILGWNVLCLQNDTGCTPTQSSVPITTFTVTTPGSGFDESLGQSNGGSGAGRNNNVPGSWQVTDVPESSSLAIALCGFAMIGFVSTRKRKPGDRVHTGARSALRAAGPLIVSIVARRSGGFLAATAGGNAQQACAQQGQGGGLRDGR